MRVSFVGCLLTLILVPQHCIFCMFSSILTHQIQHVHTFIESLIPEMVYDKGNIQNSYEQYCSKLLHAGKKVWLLLDTDCYEWNLKPCGLLRRGIFTFLNQSHLVSIKMDETTLYSQEKKVQNLSLGHYIFKLFVLYFTPKRFNLVSYKVQIST